MTPLFLKNWRLSRRAATESTVRSSSDHAGIHALTPGAELASSMHEIEIEKDKIKSDPVKLSVLFKEMIQMCLWYVPTSALIGCSARPTLSKGKRDRPFPPDPHDCGGH